MLIFFFIKKFVFVPCYLKALKISIFFILWLQIFLYSSTIASWYSPKIIIKYFFFYGEYIWSYGNASNDESNNYTAKSREKLNNTQIRITKTPKNMLSGADNERCVIIVRKELNTRLVIRYLGIMCEAI